MGLLARIGQSTHFWVVKATGSVDLVDRADAGMLSNSTPRHPVLEDELHRSKDETWFTLVKVRNVCSMEPKRGLYAWMGPTYVCRAGSPKCGGGAPCRRSFR